MSELKDFRKYLNTKLSDNGYATSYLLDALATGKSEDIQSAVKDLLEGRPAPERHNELREALGDIRSIAKGARDSTASENKIFRVLAESVLEIATAALAEQAAPVREGE